FMKERGLELTLPRRVGRERRTGRGLASGVQVEQLRRHPANRRARLVALSLPRRRAQAVQPRRGGLAIPGRGVRLELVEPIQRDVEAGAAFVLDHGHLETAAVRPDGD